MAKVYLFNLLGQGTAEIRSLSRDLGDRAAYANAESVAVLTSGVVRTETVYDTLGHVVAQRLPSFTSTGTGNAAPNGLRVQEGFVNAGIRQAYEVLGDETSTSSNGGNQISVQWGALDQWGHGKITVSIDYTATTATGTPLNPAPWQNKR